MTQDEILEMARQAGFDFLNGWRDWGESCEYGEAWLEQIEAFAKLVEARTAEKEREACAKICVKESKDKDTTESWRKSAEYLAVLIRARAQAERGEAWE